MKPDELAKTIEHTLIDPRATPEDVERCCAEAREAHFACVCVLPEHVERVADHLRGADVKISTLVGTTGAEPTRAKVAEAERALAAGAHEVDVLLNVEGMLRGEFRAVQDDATAVVRAIRVRGANSARGGVLVKVVLDPAPLGEKLKRLACKIVEDSGADFGGVVAGADGSPSLRDVELLRECLSESLGVKAGAAVSSLEDLYELVNAGAARIGTADAARILGSVARAAS